MLQVLNQVDLAFVVDTTGSMGPFIQAAQQQMTAMLYAVTQDSNIPIDLRVGIVEYRNHPPQDRSFVFRKYKFREDLKRIQRVINKLSPDGGGDIPEAVYDGLQAACDTLHWRDYSQRLAILIGDAPPHPQCLCGLTSDSITALLEQNGIILYALGLRNSVQVSFSDLAQRTGGLYFSAEQGNKAIQQVQTMLQAEFRDLAFDAQVLDVCQKPNWTVDSVCTDLESDVSTISLSLNRLGRRGLL